MWQRYVRETPQRVKLVDVFMVFLVVVGVLQFAYCVLAGNYVCFFLPQPPFPEEMKEEEEEKKTEKKTEKKMEKKMEKKIGEG